MIICFNKEAERMPKRNSHLDDGDVVSIVGLEIIVKNPSNDELRSYISNIAHISKKSVNDKQLKMIGENYITRYHMNKILKEFEKKIKHNKLVRVIEDDGYTERLVNTDTIVEVRSFATDPEDDSYKKRGLNVVANIICGDNN